MRYQAVMVVAGVLSLGVVSCSDKDQTQAETALLPMPVTEAANVAGTAPEGQGTGQEVEDGDLVGTDLAGDAPTMRPDGQAIMSHELAQAFPEAHTRWMQYVSRVDVGGTYWVSSLDNTSKPLTMVNVLGRPYLLGYVCELHRCGTNEVIFLMTPDQSRILGLARLTNDNDQSYERIIGAASRAELACLRFYMDNEDSNAACGA